MAFNVSLPGRRFGNVAIDQSVAIRQRDEGDRTVGNVVAIMGGIDEAILERFGVAQLERARSEFQS